MNFLTNPNPNKLELNVFVLKSEWSKEKNDEKKIYYIS